MSEPSRPSVPTNFLGLLRGLRQQAERALEVPGGGIALDGKSKGRKDRNVMLSPETLDQPAPGN